jgi:Mg-chelatase subunit ChlD
VGGVREELAVAREALRPLPSPPAPARSSPSLAWDGTTPAGSPSAGHPSRIVATPIPADPEPPPTLATSPDPARVDLLASAAPFTDGRFYGGESASSRAHRQRLQRLGDEEEAVPDIGLAPRLAARLSPEGVPPDGAATVTLQMHVGEPPQVPVGPGSDDDLPSAEDDRPPTHLCFAVDVSGSMAEGGRLDQAVEAVCRVLARLGPADRVSVVAFGSSAQAVVPPSPVTPEARTSIRRTLQRLVPGGNTDYESALLEVARCLAASGGGERLQHAVLVSDGAPTQGARDPDALARRARRLVDDGACLDVIGVGDAVPLPVLTALAQAGHGAVHVVVDEGALVDVVEDSVRQRLRPPDPAGVLRFVPGADVTVRGQPAGWVVDDDGAWVAELGPVQRRVSLSRALELDLAGPRLPGSQVEVGQLSLVWEARPVRRQSTNLQVTVLGPPSQATAAGEEADGAPLAVSPADR